MKRLLRITVLFSVTLLWWGEKGYAATPAMDAAEKETVSATVEAEADKKDPKSDKKSDEPKRKRNLGHLSGSFETNTIYYVEDSKTGAVVPHNSYGSNNFLKLDYQLGRFSAGVQLEYYPHPLVGTPMQGYEYVMEGFSINNLTEKYISWTDRNYSVTVGDFYEQFGSGLILRAWEDRALGFNNSLGGARVTFNIKDIVEGKVLYAFPRFNLGYLSTQIAGGDLSFSLSNAIGLLDHRLSLEGSIVNRHFKNLPSWYTTENDIQKTNNETLPVFNHVLRAALTNMEGDPIAPAVAEAGERSFDFEVSLNNGWDSQNCEFVIYVFKEEEDAAFIVNNGAVCPVGGKVDYKYESVK